MLYYVTYACPLLSNFLARIKYARNVQRTKEHRENEWDREGERKGEREREWVAGVEREKESRQNSRAASRSALQFWSFAFVALYFFIVSRYSRQRSSENIKRHMAQSCSCECSSRNDARLYMESHLRASRALPTLAIANSIFLQFTARFNSHKSSHFLILATRGKEVKREKEKECERKILRFTVR